MNRTQGVEVRPIREEDRAGVLAFLGALSPDTHQLRFFTRASPARLLDPLVVPTEERDLLLAAYGGAVVGHGMAVRQGDGVEIALVVADDWQGRGVGGDLLRLLLRRAYARGCTRVTMDVLGDNRRVLRMIKSYWPDARATVSSGTVEVRAELSPHLFSPGLPAGPRSEIDEHSGIKTV
ncbi:GNAT family N-acetyltransferase [Bailinhaonella thermotolerans]|uniref:GNAT family N-acetyltransferase n=1 Tax=Bailinhaonella thermotolerans TaxID=1070861 RepID=A0A3A4AUU2_9ACTN|nr:GNAT family N-acetyltransferase [Bailinhaonella thermotolerans]RJL32045.1 GNAT family N-acetyltransferase [Bailinhaonella thermotolerans]